MKSTEENELPITKIRGIEFEVDINEQEFRKVGDSEHTIWFGRMVYCDTHYLLPFDLFTEKAADYSMLEHEDVVWTKVPLLVEIAPEQMARKYKIPLSDLQYRTDFDLAVDMELYNLRVNELPTMRIYDRDYKVNLEANELNNALGDLSLRDFRGTAEGYFNYAYLDTRTHTIVEIDLNTIKVLPEHVVRIEIDYAVKLDPFGYADLMGHDVKTFLLWHPIAKDLNARVLPLEKTPVMKHIIENKRKEAEKLRIEKQRAEKRKVRNGLK